ncbi:MAG: sensor domain-containing diguanylate cyclase [Elusimicrobia bacterium]|nr:sensor domain-containing diguanylate cyclase [Elusimicrobiota bacterium]
MRQTSQLYTPIRDDSAPLIYLSTEFIRAKEYLEAIVASTSDAIWTTDLSGRIIYFSPGAEKMLGRSLREAFAQSAAGFFAGGRLEASRIHRHLLAQGSLAEHETVLLRADKSKVRVSMSAALLKDRSGTIIGTLAISKDISRRIELEERLRELSITDDLTGLYNQRHFHEVAGAELRRAKRQGEKFSLLVIDLDHFKRANDLWGHLEGDRILQGTARAIRSCIRGDVDMAFRYGGDEFVVILPGLGEKTARSVAERIAAAAAKKPFAKLVGLSIGAAALRPSDSLNDLLRRADSRMYRAKRRKKSAG